jgi:NAD(P)-dependent dehydrogenase (short-subunit alcohol dehydrogenase family)
MFGLRRVEGDQLTAMPEFTDSPVEEAGFEPSVPLSDPLEAEVRRSLFPTLWCCRAVLPGMLERGAGVIVNISSVDDARGQPCALRGGEGRC